MSCVTLRDQFLNEVKKWMAFYQTMIADLKETKPKLQSLQRQNDCDELIQSFEEKVLTCKKILSDE